MTRFLPLGLLLISVLPLTAQEPNQASGFRFHTPETWRGEVIQLPPGFAPGLKWHGVESIRFAPGMFRPDSESFFSYVLVFLIGKDDDVGEKALHEQILTYYRGLARAVMGGKGIPVDEESFRLNLAPVEDGKTSQVPAAAGGDGMKAWTGKLDWIEPFATQKPQQLNLEVHLWRHDDRPVLYFTVSPQPTDHAIWKEMRGYREKFEIRSVKNE